MTSSVDGPRAGRWLARIALFGGVAALLIGLLFCVSSPLRSLRTLLVLFTDVPVLSFPDLPPEQEFQRVAKALHESRNDFHGRKQLQDWLDELNQPGLDASDRCEAEAAAAMELLRLGQLEQAIERIESALNVAENDASLKHLLPRLWRTGAIVYLRAAEQQNCVERHGAESCLFPIRGGGVHMRRHSAELARRLLLRYMNTDPPDREGMVWLLNVVCMILGEYPDAVPPNYRLKSSRVESESRVPRFVDVGPAVGVSRLSLAGGVAVLDFDHDGRLDILSSTSDPLGPLALFHNLGDGTFRDVAARAGLRGQLGGLHCQAVDYNNDGHQDLYILRGGWLRTEGRIRNSLLRNNGDGTFTDVTREAGLADPPYPSQAAVWADFDNDGWLDLFVANESMVELVAWPPLNFPCQLFRNNGDGTFTDIAARAGVRNYGWAKGVAAGDYDNDGDIDLYVSNHSLWDDSYGANRLYRNNGDGTFTDVAAAMGVRGPARSFATWFFDYDNDGWLDLFVCPYGAPVEGDVLAATARDYQGLPHQGVAPCLYRNEQGRRFVDVTRSVGLDHPWLAMGAGYGDIDNDGWLDIYLGTGEPRYEAIVPNVLLRSDRGRRFLDVTTAAGVGHLQKGHGIALADFDNDGDQDIYADLGGFYPGDRFMNALFLNRDRRPQRFLKLQLVGTTINRQAVGARVAVKVDTPEGRRTIHRVAGLTSSFGSHPPRLEIGLGMARRIVEVSIEWSVEGLRQVLNDVPLNSLLRVTQSVPEFELLSLDPIDFEQHLPPDEVDEGAEEPGALVGGSPSRHHQPHGDVDENGEASAKQQEPGATKSLEPEPTYGEAVDAK